MLKEVMQYLENQHARDAEIFVRRCLAHARHPRAVPAMIESFKARDPSIASALIIASVNPDVPHVLRMNLFKIVEGIGFRLSDNALQHLEEAMLKFDKTEQIKAIEIIQKLR